MANSASLSAVHAARIPAPSLAASARPGFWTLHITGWSAFAIAMIMSRIGVFPMDYMIVAKGAYAAVGAVVALGLRVVFRRVIRKEPPLYTIIITGVVASYLAALVWTAGANAVTFAAIDPIFRDRTPSMTVRSLTNGSLYNAFIMLAWSLLYFGIKWQHALVAERERVLRAESMANEAKLDALRYQLNPHLLFNALNGVSALVLEQRTQEAAEMLSRLAAFLRLTLEGNRGNEHALDDELLYLRSYLAIEQARFGDRLQPSFEIDPDARRALVPTLLLQPIIENSVQHVVAKSVGGGTIAVEANVSDGMLALSVTDHCTVSDCFPHHDDGPRGIGLSNTRERLHALYGDKGTLAFERLQNAGARVVIRLPYHRSGDARG